MLPFNSLGSVLDRMATLSQAIDDTIPDGAQSRNGSRLPQFWVPVDCYETAAAYVVEADVAGVDPKDIDVSFERHTLVIRGTRAPSPRPAANGELRVYTAERPSGEFSRLIRLPETVDGERIEASHANGVLKVTVPKAAAARTRKITVNGANSKPINS